MTKYIYVKKMCSACDELKTRLLTAGTVFTERDGDRLSLDPRIMDEIDKEAFIQLQQQNLTFPVEVDIKEN